MFENIENLKITGGGFRTTSKLKNIFNDWLTVIYGRNGSGKSSISKAISEFVNDDVSPKKFKVDFGRALTDEEKASVFVFNEKYVRDNVYIDSETLEPIPMLGEASKIDEDIAAKKLELSDKENESRDLGIRIADLKSKSKSGSAEVQLADLKTKFKAKDGFLNRLSEISVSTLSQISANMLTDIFGAESNPDISNEIGMTIPELMPLLNESIRQIKAKKDMPKITVDRSAHSLPFSPEAIDTLIHIKVENPSLTERDKAILKIIEDNHLAGAVSSTKHLYVGEESINICPFCHQDITSGTKADIETRLKRIWSREADEYKSSLNATLSTIKHIEEKEFPDGRFDEEKMNYHNAVEVVNQEIEKIAEIIKHRIESPFSDFNESVDKNAITDSLQTCNHALSALIVKAESYNKSVSITAITSRAKALNNLITHKEYNKEIADYLASKYELETKTNNKAQLDTVDIPNLKKEISLLEDKKDKVNVALDFINRCLRFIFADKDRLYLVGTPKEGYKLFSRGCQIPPKAASEGEQNAIGLAYFFASLFKGKRESEMFKTPMLVVIDDPITSFDADNKMGVTSLIEWGIQHIHDENPQSKVVVLSHDKHIVDSIARIKGGENSYQAIRNNVLVEPEQWWKENDYQRLLLRIFEFAKYGNNRNGNEGTSIGNAIRRVIDGYVSFEYNRPKLEMVLSNPRIMDQVPSAKRDFYRAFGQRLSMMTNSESHASNYVDTFDNFDALFTDSEKQNTAKLFLLLIFYTNPQHLWAHLGERCNDIEGWKTTVHDTL